MRALTALLLAMAVHLPCLADERPNIIVFITDDQSALNFPHPDYAAGSFGYENEKVYTPHIDELARQGIVFSRAYVSSSVCAASRYSLLTGRYASRSQSERFLTENPPGVPSRVENNVELESGRPNLPSILREHGYRTGFVGKSHVASHAASLTPEEWGKTYDLKTYAKDADPRDPDVNAAMRFNHDRWREDMAAFGFDFADAVYIANLDMMYNNATFVHNLEWTTDAALRFIESTGDEPFFLYYATTLPHGPAPWIEGRQRDAPRPPTPKTGNSQADDGPSLAQRAGYWAVERANNLILWIASRFPGRDTATAGGLIDRLVGHWSHNIYPAIRKRTRFPHGLHADPRMTGEGFVDRTYDFMPERDAIIQELVARNIHLNEAWMTWVDHAIAAIRHTLEDQGKWDNTLFLITSDHGDWRGGKASLYEGGLRVPMLAHWPATVEPGSRYDGLVQNTDIAPTLLEVAGVKDYDKLETDGASLRGVLRGDRDAVHDYLYAEIGFARAIITRDWKYIATRYSKRINNDIAQGKTFVGMGGVKLELPYLTRNQHLGYHSAKHNPNYFAADQLYNLSADPREEHNVFADESAVVARMQYVLGEKLHRLPCRPFGEFVQPPCRLESPQ